VIVHRQAGAGEEIQEATVLSIANQLAVIDKSSGIGHINRDCMPMTEGRLRDELVEGGPSREISIPRKRI